MEGGTSWRDGGSIGSRREMKEDFVGWRRFLCREEMRDGGI